MIVMDHHGTALLIAMAMNVPGVYFWDPANLPLAPQAEPYYDQLRKNGILCDSPEAAASKINEVWDDVDEWWQSREIQDVRNMYCYRYARFAENWRRDWLRFFNSLGVGVNPYDWRDRC